MFKPSNSQLPVPRVNRGDSVEVLLITYPFNSSRWRVDPGTENHRRLLGERMGASRKRVTVGDEDFACKIVRIGEPRKHVSIISQAVERLQAVQ